MELFGQVLPKNTILSSPYLLTNIFFEVLDIFKICLPFLHIFHPQTTETGIIKD